MLKHLALLILVTGCCVESDRSTCTAEENAEIDAYMKPKKVSELNGVILWQQKRCYRCSVDPIYFTTPCGDVSWTEHRRSGKSTRQIPHQVNGQGCQP